MENCLFCKILNKEIPSTVVYEDDKVFAFKDIDPAAPVHVLIIPKTHIENVESLTEENVDYVSAIHLAAQKVAREMGVADKGYRLINNCGKDAGQTVFHLHYHLLGGRVLGDKIV